MIKSLEEFYNNTKCNVDANTYQLATQNSSNDSEWAVSRTMISHNDALDVTKLASPDSEKEELDLDDEIDDHRSDRSDSRDLVAKLPASPSNTQDTDTSPHPSF